MEEQNLTKKERRQLRKEEEHQQRAQSNKKAKVKKFFNVIIGIVVTLAVLVGLYFLLGLSKKLPPTSMQGHIEQSPPSHIVSTPMDYRIHQHMLEHADGTGPGGVIINYNCIDYECESDFIDKLTALVKQYPSNVYLAPWPKMSAKLVITALNRQKVLDGFNEQELRDFIDR